MNSSIDLRYFRQLCTLRADSSAIILDAIGEVAQAMDMDMCCFNWVDERGELSHAHTAGISPALAVVEHYTQHYVNREEAELGITTQQRTHRPQIIAGSREMGHKFRNTVLHNEILKPIGLRYIAAGSVLTQGRLVATFSGNRAADRREFNQAEYAQLEHILSYLALAAMPREPSETSWHEQNERAMLIVDRHGAIQYADELAQNRLYRATQRHLGNAAGKADAAHPVLQDLATAILLIERGAEMTAPRKSLVVDGRRFVFTAQALRKNPEQALEFVAISIEEWVPDTLRLLPWLREHNLSLRQRELTLHIRDGLTLADAARVMNIKPSTAEDYIDVIYRKLNVRNREALLQRLYTFNTSH